MRFTIYKSLLYLVVTAIALAGFTFVWHRFTHVHQHNTDSYRLLVIISTFVCGFHYILVKKGQESSRSFNLLFLGFMVARFFIYLGILAFMVWKTNGNKQSLILLFMLYYAAFTFVEVKMLFTVVKKLK